MAAGICNTLTLPLSLNSFTQLCFSENAVLGLEFTQVLSANTLA